MKLLAAFLIRFRANLTAWYLENRGDFYSCDTCGGWDNTKPEREEIEEIIVETLKQMEEVHEIDYKDGTKT